METIKDLVSVVVPIYNTPENLLRKCIESIKEQSYKSIEIILVDDGSTNNALEVYQSFQDDDIHVIHQDNQGVSVARNIGIEKSLGQWIMFVDPDDELELNALEVLLSNVDSNVDIVAACCTIKSKDNSSVSHFFDGNRCFTSDDKNDLYCKLQLLVRTVIKLSPCPHPPSSTSSSPTSHSPNSYHDLLTVSSSPQTSIN